MAEKGETEKKKRNPTKKWKKYEISGDKIKRKDKFCPKCGVGVFLARHKDRISCGKCGYTEFTKK
ncbi:MAG: 30S ribosomal protein S27ae [Candidatus Altiarchaeota archaeon]